MTRSTRRRCPRGSALLLVPLVLMMALSACGDDDTASGATSDPSDDAEAGREFARCMRENGVPDFPDPGPDGQLAQPHGDEDDPEFRAAMDECRELAPGSEHQDTGDPEYVEQQRRFAQCMRENGLPDFPDPDANGQIELGHGEGGYGDPKVDEAMEACRDEMPGGDH
jgi:hypothetical protein